MTTDKPDAAALRQEMLDAFAEADGKLTPRLQRASRAFVNRERELRSELYRLTGDRYGVQD